MSPGAIGDAILAAAAARPDAPALTVGGETLSYMELVDGARALAARLPEAAPPPAAPVLAVLATEDVAAYQGVLAAVLAGWTIVPINPRQPAARNADMLARSGASLLIASKSADAAAAGLPDDSAISGNVGPSRLYRLAAATQPASDATSPTACYILFTSGSTGAPKGVAISHANLEAYLAAAGAALGIGPDDRMSQTFEMTFDLSMHGIFLAWTRGAHLIAATRQDLKDPGDYLRRSRLTSWFSTPSLAFQMQLQGALRPNAYPGLRTSHFCGEALPTALARAWQAAAPNSRVENWYGPTEATIACARFVLPPPGEQVDADVMPIGAPFPGTEALVCDDDLNPVADGVAGELVLGGPQVAAGYLRDPDRTRQSFVTLPGRAGRYYRTGDRAVVRDGRLAFLGRIDAQIKLRGYRIELGEIEAALRDATCGRNAVALAWPPDDARPRAIMAAIEGDLPAGMDAALAALLPDYMLPAAVQAFRAFPVNASGKTDRKRIAAEIAGRLAAVKSAPTPDEPAAAKLLELIERTAPALERKRIFAAKTLLGAGMDSLAFVALTAEIETAFDIELDQHQVAALARMPFAAAAAYLAAGAPATTAASRPASEAVPPRAHRALEFVRRFPRALASDDRPAVLAIGSSGTQRGFDCATFEATATAAGWPVRAFNAGLPSINCRGLAQAAAFVRETAEAAGVRFALVLFELDPMLVSEAPPAGDLDLGPAFFDPATPLAAPGALDVEFYWPEDARGRPAFDVDAYRKRVVAAWVRKRDKEIAAAYLGRMAFRAAELDHWRAGVRALRPVADRIVGFIHPLNGLAPADTDLTDRDNRYLAMVRGLEASTGVRFLDPSGFELDDADFLNMNHMNPWRGMARLSAQLAEMCLPTEDARPLPAYSAG